MPVQLKVAHQVCANNAKQASCKDSPATAPTSSLQENIRWQYLFILYFKGTFITGDYFGDFKDFVARYKRILKVLFVQIDSPLSIQGYYIFHIASRIFFMVGLRTQYIWKIFLKLLAWIFFHPVGKVTRTGWQKICRELDKMEAHSQLFSAALKTLIGDNVSWQSIFLVRQITNVYELGTSLNNVTFHWSMTLGKYGVIDFAPVSLLLHGQESEFIDFGK